MIRTIESEITSVLGLARNLTLRVEFEEGFSAKQESYVVMVLDVSGSMSGSAIRNAKEGAKALVSELATNAKFCLVTYNRQATGHNLTDCDVRGMHTLIDSIRASGTTSFTAAFQKTSKMVRTLPAGAQVSVVFMTDGNDTSSLRGSIEPALAELVATLRTHTTDPQMHCLGYSMDHDASFLGQVSTALNRKGTSQFIQGASNLPEALNNLVPLLRGSRASVQLIEKDSGRAHNVSLEEVVVDEGCSQFRGELFLPADSAAVEKFTLRIETRDADGEHVYTQEVVPVLVEPTLAGVANKMVGLVSDRIIETTRQLVHDNPDAAALVEIENDVKELDGNLDSLYAEASKMPAKLRASRKETMAQCLQAKELVNQFWDVFRKKKIGALENEDIARMNDLAYRRNLKRGMARKLDQRAATNADLFHNKVYPAIAEVQKQFEEKEEELVAKYGNEDVKKFTCFMTTSNWVETLAEGGCLGFSMAVTRSQACIADPSQLTVESVGKGCLEASSFQDSYEYMLEQAATEDTTGVHGGFERKTGQVLEYAGYKFNAMVPLYISEEHWQSARHWMKPIMGLITTLDPMGYQWNQIGTVPFLALATAFEQYQADASEHNKWVVDELTKTCQAIYRDASRGDTKMSTRIVEAFEKFAASPAGRTVDAISNNRVFVAQTYIAMMEGDLERLDETQLTHLVGLFVEEECRRRQYGHPHNTDLLDKTASVFALLGVDREIWIDQHIAHFREQHVKEGVAGGFRGKMLNALRTAGVDVAAFQTTEEKKEEAAAPANSDPETFDGSYPTMTEAARAVWATTVENYRKGVRPLQQIWGLLAADSVDTSVVTKDLEGLGLLTAEQQLVFALQNYIHYKSSYRREAFTKGTYVNPFVLKEAKSWIAGLFAKHVRAEKKRKMNDYLSQKFVADAMGRAEVFANTTDEVEAAGSLMNTYVGRDVRFFFRKLQTDNHPLALNKILMLITGKYKGVVLYADKDRQDGRGWIPKQPNVHKLWKRNFNLISREDWEYLLKDCPTAFPDWYADLTREVGEEKAKEVVTTDYEAPDLA